MVQLYGTKHSTEALRSGDRALRSGYRVILVRNSSLSDEGHEALLQVIASVVR
jgi:hypothetical protein